MNKLYINFKILVYFYNIINIIYIVLIIMHIRWFATSHNTIKTKNQKLNYINQNNIFFFKIYNIKYINKISEKDRKQLISSIFNEEKTSKISSNQCLS